MKVSGHAIEWKFLGEVDGDKLAGTANMGEYGTIGFKAVRG